jgi:hypothetical protein
VKNFHMSCWLLSMPWIVDSRGSLSSLEQTPCADHITCPVSISLQPFIDHIDLIEPWWYNLY